MEKPTQKALADEKAFMILRVLSKKSSKEVTLFRSVYEELFSQTRVPPIQKFAELVIVDRIQAIDYLKQQHNFYTKQELAQEIKEAVKDVYFNV